MAGESEDVKKNKSVAVLQGVRISVAAHSIYITVLHVSDTAYFCFFLLYPLEYKALEKMLEMSSLVKALVVHINLKKYK